MAPPSWAHIGDEFNDLPRSFNLLSLIFIILRAYP